MGKGILYALCSIHMQYVVTIKQAREKKTSL